MLAICYGMQLVAHQKGGELSKSQIRTYGQNTVLWKEELIPNNKNQVVWMSHGDSVEKIPPKAKILAKDKKGLIVAFSMDNLWAFQFHPEVSHTKRGSDLLESFAKNLCKTPLGSWSLKIILEHLLTRLKGQVSAYRKDFLCFERRG